MTHPDILRAEAHGGRITRGAEQILGECEFCGTPIISEYEYWEDFDNLFCSRECADKYHGLKCVN